MPDTRTVAYLQIEIKESGALSVAGSIDNEAYAIAALQAAIDAVRSHHSHKQTLIIPGYDTDVNKLRTN